jgi:hypothetical protein
VDICSPIFELGVWLLSGCRHNRALDADNQFDKIAPGIIGAIKMNFSQTQDERLLAFYENVRRQVDLDMRAGGRTGLLATVRNNTPTDFAMKWTGDSCGLHRLFGIHKASGERND